MTTRVAVPEKVLNTEQHKCEPYKAEIKKAETKWVGRLKTYIKETWAFRSKITVEPFVVCYILPSVLGALAVQNLSLEKSCLVNLQYDERTCSNIMQGYTHNISAQEKKVQKMVSTMTAWSYPLQTALPGILTLFLGSWSDRTGNRKIFMMLPILGKLLSTIGLILSRVFMMDVGVSETALLDGLPPAIAGGRVAMTMAVYSYITDITTESERTFRLGIITAILTLTRPVGLALSGYMTKSFGYYGIFSVACVFYMVGFVYASIRLKKNSGNVKNVDNEETLNCLSMFSFKDLVETVNVAVKARKGTRRVQIYLILLAYMLIVGPVLGEAQMTYWFTRYKFKFTEVDYSLFLTYSVLLGIAGSFITIYIFTKRWKMDDSLMGIIACVSRIAASVVYAFAPTRTVYFLGPVLDMFSSAGAAALRSIATKLVDSDEIGKTSSLISISEALVPVIYSPIYSMLYQDNLSTMPGAFYLFSAVLVIPAIMLMIALYFIRRKDEKNATEENKPKENEITSF